MKLSMLPSSLQLSIRKDGEFNLLGKATTTYSEGQLALSYLTELRYLEGMSKNPNIGCVIVAEELADQVQVEQWGIVVSKDPKLTFVHIHNALADQEFYWEHFPNAIAASAVISPMAFIDVHSVRIGERVIIEPQVTIHSGTIIGDDCIIRSGTRIGSNGYEFIREGDALIQVKCAGRAILEHHVEIQHNCCVDRGMYGGDTLLKPYVKVDNLCHVAHDCVIGERTAVTGGSIIAGRTIIGSDVWVGPNTTISNGLTIGDASTITIGAVVTRDVAPGQTVTGNFAIDHAKFLAFLKSIR
jgi:UDP-3-O-[3-hydroxymyristoyl] glucosamine N-acyltransferase LpxD